MTIHNSRNLTEFECDACGDVIQLNPHEFDDFSAIHRHIISEGWRSRRTGNIWHHYCAKCGTKIDKPVTLDAVNQALFGGKK